MQRIIKFLKHLRVIPDIMSSGKPLNDFRLFTKRSILLTNLIVINIILLVTMTWARIYKKCHNLVQVIAGSILGAFIAFFIYNIKIDS